MCTTLLCLGALVLFVGCVRRPLDYEPKDPTKAIIHLHFDWSKSGLDMNDMHRASIWVFPQEDDYPLNKGIPSSKNDLVEEFRMEGSFTDYTIELPVGVYSFLVFNETIDPGDFTTLAFENTNSYDRFSVYAKSKKLSAKRTKESPGELYAETPESIASWSMDYIRVTPEMILVTNPLGNDTKSLTAEQHKEVEVALKSLSAITPEPLTRGVHIVARVVNLNTAQKMSYTMKNLPQGIVLATKKPLTTLVSQTGEFTQRVFDNPSFPKDGEATVDFLAFGIGQLPDHKYDLQLDYELYSGESVPPDKFDITTQVGADSQKTTIVINVGHNSPNPEEDRPIILPETETKPDVDVGDWENNDVDIH